MKKNLFLLIFVFFFIFFSNSVFSISFWNRKDLNWQKPNLIPVASISLGEYYGVMFEYENGGYAFCQAESTFDFSYCATVMSTGNERDRAPLSATYLTYTGVNMVGTFSSIIFPSTEYYFWSLDTLYQQSSFKDRVMVYDDLELPSDYFQDLETATIEAERNLLEYQQSGPEYIGIAGTGEYFYYAEYKDSTDPTTFWASPHIHGVRDVYLVKISNYRLMYFIHGKGLIRLEPENPSSYQYILINGKQLKTTSLWITPPGGVRIYVDHEDEPNDGGIYSFSLKDESGQANFNESIDYYPTVDIEMAESILSSSGYSRGYSFLSDDGVDLFVVLPEKLVQLSPAQNFSVNSYPPFDFDLAFYSGYDNVFFVNSTGTNTFTGFLFDSNNLAEPTDSREYKLEIYESDTLFNTMNFPSNMKSIAWNKYFPQYYNIIVDQNDLKIRPFEFEDNIPMYSKYEPVIDNLLVFDDLDSSYVFVSQSGTDSIFETQNNLSNFNGSNNNNNTLQINGLSSPFDGSNLLTNVSRFDELLNLNGFSPIEYAQNRWLGITARGDFLSGSVEGTNDGGKNFTLETALSLPEFIGGTPGLDFTEEVRLYRIKNDTVLLRVSNNFYDLDPSNGDRTFLNWFPSVDEIVVYDTDPSIIIGAYGVFVRGVNLESQENTVFEFCNDCETPAIQNPFIYNDRFYVAYSKTLYSIDIVPTDDNSTSTIPFKFGDSNVVIEFESYIMKTDKLEDNLVNVFLTSEVVVLQLDCPLNETSPYCLRCNQSEYRSFEENQCIPCEDNHYTIYNAECIPCPAGTDLLTANITCVPCPLGYGSEEGGDCIECVGNEIPLNGDSACLSCVDQKPRSVPRIIDDEYRCVTCNNSLAIANGTECIPCPNGTFPDSDTGTECLGCGPNQVFSEELEICQTCDAGSVPINKFECGACEAGTRASPSTGTCVPCPAGEVSSRGQTECSSCEWNEYTNDGIVCESCPKNRYSNGTECFLCPYGYILDYGENNNNNNNNTETFFTNYYNDNNNNIELPEETFCQPCEPGSIPTFNQTNCIACGPGFIAPNASMTTCISCPFRHYSAGGIECIECDSNERYDPEDNICVSCPSNSFVNTTMNECIACSGNTIAQSGQCVTCDPGTIANRTANECVRCRDNTIANEGRCQACDSGTTPNEDHTVCIEIEECDSDNERLVDGECVLICSQDCESLGKECNTETGNCICPPNTYGRLCQGTEEDKDATVIINRVGYSTSVVFSAATTAISGVSTLSTSLSPAVTNIGQFATSFISMMFHDMQFSAFIGNFQLFSSSEFEQFSETFYFSLFVLPDDVSSSSSSSSSALNSSSLILSINNNNNSENQNDSNNNENENNRFIDIQDLWIVVSAFIGLIIVYASILLIYGLVALFYIRSLRVPKNRNRFLRNYFNNNIRLTLIAIPGLTYFSIYHLSLGSGTFQIVLSSIITFLCFMFWISISILLIWNRKRLHDDKMFREKFGCLYEDYKNNRWMFAIIHLAYRSAIAFFAAISYVHNITGITLALASAILFFSSILLGQPFHSRSLNAFRGITSAIEVVVLALNLMVINDSVNPSAVAIQIHGAAVIVLCCIKMMLTISFYIGQFVIKLRQGEISLPFWKKHSVESEAGKAPKQASKKYGEPEGSKCSSDEEMEEIENNNENE